MVPKVGQFLLHTFWKFVQFGAPFCTSLSKKLYFPIGDLKTLPSFDTHHIHNLFFFDSAQQNQINIF